ncbi:hypothetical protein ABW19_dt0208526 [Dactylella cylindrospora]|nr:hypothetical protein ABW19_dt0208526 [Dactylella cylindrospora]
MLFKTLLPSAILIASQLAPASAGPVPGPGPVALARRDFYNEASAGMLDFHQSNKRDYRKEKREAMKRDLPWHPDRLWSSSFGYHEWYKEKACDTTDRRKWSYGVLVRTITYPDPDTGLRQYDYWQNSSSYWTDYYYPTGQTSCHLFGNPKYDPGTQCTDKIWNPSTQQWLLRSSSNTNTGWTTNNASYAGHKVRTIYDCLLNRTAIEYGTTVSAFGFKPVQYTLDNIKYYRFYDNNNFAWFVACPTTWPGAWKRHLEDIEAGRLEKRCNGCKGVNPVWDFFAPRQRNPLADTTDIHDYQEALEEEDPAFTDQIRYAITYWPPSAQRNVTVDGHTCIQTAVSRPGLRHWTVRFFDNAEYGYVQYSQEYHPTSEDYN